MLGEWDGAGSSWLRLEAWPQPGLYLMSLGLSFYMRKTKRLDPKISLAWLSEILKYILITLWNIYHRDVRYWSLGKGYEKRPRATITISTNMDSVLQSRAKQQSKWVNLLHRSPVRRVNSIISIVWRRNWRQRGLGNSPETTQLVISLVRVRAGIQTRGYGLRVHPLIHYRL